MYIGWVFRTMWMVGSADKTVQCEHCHGAFHYTIHRRVDYSCPLFPGSLALLERTCQRQLAERLDCDVEPLSCPLCGWVQSDMTRELRRRFLKSFRYVAKALIAGMIGALVLIALAVIWERKYSNSTMGSNVDWLGLAFLCLAGIPGGILLLALRTLLAALRYPFFHGFKPRRPLQTLGSMAMPDPLP